MARRSITMTDGGFATWLKELEDAQKAMPDLFLEALIARQKVIEKAIQQTWVSMGGQMGGFIWSSVGQSATFSKENANDVVGTIGVYDIDSVKSQFGKTPKDLNAAQIAYWTENGTSRLRNGGRKKNGVEYPDEMLITTAPKPFIQKAVYSSWQDAEKAFIDTFNREYEKRIK